MNSSDDRSHSTANAPNIPICQSNHYDGKSEDMHILPLFKGIT